jgi:hypothetical protein
MVIDCWVKDMVLRRYNLYEVFLSFCGHAYTAANVTCMMIILLRQGKDVLSVQCEAGKKHSCI